MSTSHSVYDLRYKNFRVIVFLFGTLTVLLGLYATGPWLVELGTEYFSPDKQLSEHSIAALHALQIKIILSGVILLLLSLLPRWIVQSCISLTNSIVECCAPSTVGVSSLADKAGSIIRSSISLLYRIATNEKIVWSFLGVIILATEMAGIFLTMGYHAEGIDLNPAKNFARHGIYATLSSRGFDEFTYRISVGPGILLPQALVFKLFGVNLYFGRALQACYVIAAVIVFYFLVCQLYDRKVALISLVLFVPTMLANTRSASDGYIPALLYFLLGTMFWWRSVERDRKSYLVASGLMWSLAFQTKWLYLFSVFSVILTCGVLRLFGKGLPRRYWTIPAGMVLLVTGTWVSFRIYQLGVRNEYFHLWRFWDEHMRRAIGTEALVGLMPAFLSFRPVITLSEVDLWGELQLFLLVPALVYLAIAVVKGGVRDYKSLLLGSFITVWFLWWLFLNYDLAGLHLRPVRMLGQVFVGKFLYDLWNHSFDGMRTLWQGEVGREEKKETGLGYGVKVLIAIIVVTTFVVGVGKRWDEVSLYRTFALTAKEMLAYVRENTEKDAVFSGWDWSLPWHVDLDGAADRVIKDRSTYPPEQRDRVPEYFIVSPEWPLSEYPSGKPNVAAWFMVEIQRGNAKRIAFLEEHAVLLKEFPAEKLKWMLFKIKDEGVDRDKSQTNLTAHP